MECFPTLLESSAIVSQSIVFTVCTLFRYVCKLFPVVFSNPPTNLKCKVQFSRNNPPWPLIVMDWDYPGFVALGEVEEYIVTATNGLNINHIVEGTAAEEDLSGIDDYETTEELYDLFVAAYSQGNPRSAPARCTIKTVDRGSTVC